MERTIWKFVLWEESHLAVTVVTVQMPSGAAVIHAASQDDIPTVWAEVDSDAPVEERTFEVVGTGHPLVGPPSFERCYRGTAITKDGRFVWHIYERMI